jgi:hypothetical protein
MGAHFCGNAVCQKGHLIYERVGRRRLDKGLATSKKDGHNVLTVIKCETAKTFRSLSFWRENGNYQLKLL